MQTSYLKSFKKFFLSRRGFLGVFASFIWLLKNKPLLAQEEAEESCDLKQSQAPLRWNEENIYYWIDGLHIPEGNISSRATLAVLLKHQQTTANFVDKVVLADSQDNLMAARYFSAQDKLIAGGFVPYLIFDNIDMKNSNLPLSLYIQIREGSVIKRYKFAFAKSVLKKSKLNQLYLPREVKSDLLLSHDGGTIASYYRFPTTIPFDHFGYHLVRASVIHIGEDGRFSLQIRFLHQDNDEYHYNRYFIVTDPVGRILGLVKRQYNDGQTNAVVVSQLSETDRNRFGLTKENVARINDCPYLMVFVDDVKEALVQANIWLR